ncbi:MAG: SdpI family protein [Chitinophagaceae bacterium]
MNKTLKNILMVAAALVPVAWLAFIFPGVPEVVPTHFGVDGPDAWGNKRELFVFSGILAAVSIGVYFLLQNIHRLDPKRANKDSSATFGKMAVGTVIFIAVLNFICLGMSTRNMHLEPVMMSLIGLMFAFLGNVMHNIKPNYFAGIRIPWTLSSDENWRLTHRLASKIWVAGGLLLAVIALTCPVSVTAVAMPVLLGIMVVIPIAYSFSLYRKGVGRSS